MKSISNQNGYTLLLTLLLVVIISGFIGTLSFLTLTQQKQVEKTDDEFLLADISEMGIEHYRARIINDYLAKAIEVQKRIIEYSSNNDLTEDQLTTYANNEELKGINELIQQYNKYSFTMTPINSNATENFTLTSIQVAEFQNNSLEIKIALKSTIDTDNENLQATYKIPLNLINFKISSGGPGGNGGGNGDIVEIPDFPSTIPNPFPPKDLEFCLHNGYVLSEVDCVVWLNPLPYLIWNSNIYVKDLFGSKINFLYLYNPNYKNSNFYIDASTYAYIDRNVSNVNIYTNGSFYLSNLINNNNKFTFTNTVFQSTKYIEFDSDININNTKIFSKQDSIFEKLTGDALTFYSGQNTYFNDSVSLSNSLIRSKGTVYAKNETITLENSYFLFEGNKNEIGTLTVKGDSKVCLQNQTNISSLNIIENGHVYVQGNKLTTSYQSGSKLAEVLKPQEFKAICEQSSGSSPEIDVDAETQININDILEDVQYNYID